MIVHCTSSLHARVFQYTKHLQGLRNPQNAYYYVYQQYPDDVEAERQQIIHKMKK